MAVVTRSASSGLKHPTTAGLTAKTTTNTTASPRKRNARARKADKKKPQQQATTASSPVQRIVLRVSTSPGNTTTTSNNTGSSSAVKVPHEAATHSQKIAQRGNRSPKKIILKVSPRTIKASKKNKKQAIDLVKSGNHNNQGNSTASSSVPSKITLHLDPTEIQSHVEKLNFELGRVQRQEEFINTIEGQDWFESLHDVVLDWQVGMLVEDANAWCLKEGKKEMRMVRGCAY